jgi:8-amino-7-oxononanoate synthase
MIILDSRRIRGLVAAATEGAARFGVGAGASHLITGHMAAHHSLEEALATFVGLPRALLFSTGYMANIRRRDSASGTR